jgi:oxygen-dependent protoporphyrinogen oxidase
VTQPQRIIVLGAGITGLAAAHRCRELASAQGRAVAVTVLERSERAGGCIETLYDDGYIAETGPDSLVTEKPAALDLARRLGLERDVTPMRPEYRGARVVRSGRLIPIPDDFRLFTPTSLAGLVRSRLFSPAGLSRAAVEPFVPRRRDDGDESLASFVTRRFGSDVLNRLAQPLIGGIYCGDPKRLSMQATMPQMLALERKHGSVVLAMRSASRKARGAAPPPPRLVSLRGGLGTLTAALERELRDCIQTSSDVRSLRRTAGGDGWTVALADGREMEADAVVCALPASASARLLAATAPRLSDLLASITYHTAATVTMAYAERDVAGLPRCTGFVVPHVEGRKILSATFSSQKYPGRAPAGYALLRAYIGGALQPSVPKLGDDEMVDVVRSEFRELLGITAEPLFSIVRRWPGALPEYAVGHVDLVAQIFGEVSAMEGFALAGSAYRGVGIADCIRGGEEAAQTVLSSAPRPPAALRLDEVRSAGIP